MISDDEDLGGYVLDEDIVPALWTADELSAEVAEDKAACSSLWCWSPSSNAKQQRRNLGLIVSSLSNLVIAYNFGIIDLALHNMADAYPTTTTGWADSAVASSVFAGAVTGQLFLGYAGDRLGRRRALLLTLGLVFWCWVLGLGFWFLGLRSYVLGLVFLVMRSWGRSMPARGRSRSLC